MLSPVDDDDRSSTDKDSEDDELQKLDVDAMDRGELQQAVRAVRVRPLCHAHCKALSAAHPLAPQLQSLNRQHRTELEVRLQRARLHPALRALSQRTGLAQELGSNLEAALDSIKTFHSQQRGLYDQFVQLRDKYDR